ncbi:ABC transporter permease subunit [Rhizobium leguminosarum bv. viciae]|nr:ABC transporter permease subunit [Rhizobium leguminosarum bv. viciae]
MNFDLSTIVPYGPALLSGLATTLLCWVAGSAGAMAIGFVVVLCRISPSRILSAAALFYTEIIRGTPPLLVAFFIYGAGPSFGLVLEPLPAGILALSLHGSAYMAEIYRVGFNSVPRGHVEAGISLGLTRLAIFRRIQAPEALVAITPSLVNALIVVSKETSVLSIISVPELTYEVQKMSIETFAAFESLFALAIGYWIVVSSIAKAGHYIERRVMRHTVRSV